MITVVGHLYERIFCASVRITKFEINLKFHFSLESLLLGVYTMRYFNHQSLFWEVEGLVLSKDRFMCKFLVFFMIDLNQKY